VLEVLRVWITGAPTGNYLASVTMEIGTGGHRFQIRGMRLIEGRSGKILAMPSRKKGEGWEDMFCPMTKETREVIQSAAIAEYIRQSAIRRGGDEEFGEHY